MRVWNFMFIATHSYWRLGRDCERVCHLTIGHMWLGIHLMCARVALKWQGTICAILLILRRGLNGMLK